MASTNPKTYEPTPSRKVAFLGLGVMGFPMAGHLALAGHRVTVYNRSAEKRIAWCKEFTGGAAPTPREAVATYQFNNHAIDHHFCTTCGVAPFAEGKGPQGPMVEINLRCADGVDLEALQIQNYDGASR